MSPQRKSNPEIPVVPPDDGLSYDNCKDSVSLSQLLLRMDSHLAIQSEQLRKMSDTSAPGNIRGMPALVMQGGFAVLCAIMLWIGMRVYTNQYDEDRKQWADQTREDRKRWHEEMQRQHDGAKDKWTIVRQAQDQNREMIQLIKDQQRSMDALTKAIQTLTDEVEKIKTIKKDS